MPKPALAQVRLRRQQSALAQQRWKLPLRRHERHQIHRRQSALQQQPRQR
ncbi:MAG: hypothetical protein ACRD1Y_02285 [Terriglobales bacterium]